MSFEEEMLKKTKTNASQARRKERPQRFAGSGPRNRDSRNTRQRKGSHGMNPRRTTGR